jgi:ribosome maturation factor RimP
MSSRNPLLQRLIQIIEPVLEQSGFELVDVRFLLEQGGWVLRVQADIPLDQVTDVTEVPSDRVDLSDCEDISRELSAVLDVEDPIPQMYHLEVSSPGIDRPLRTLKHFAHFTGSEAKIQLGVPLQTPSGERKNFKGVLKGVVDGKVEIECDGQLFQLVLDDIDHAKLVPDWDAVMRGKSGLGKTAAADEPKPVKPGHRPSQKSKSQKPQKQKH